MKSAVWIKLNLIPLFRNYNEDSNEEEDEEESEEEDSDEEEDEEEDNYYKAMGHSCEYEDSHVCLSLWRLIYTRVEQMFWFLGQKGF